MKAHLLNKNAAPTETEVTSSQDWATRFAGATRDIYRRTLQELARHDARIYCLDSDQGGLEDSFARALPQQYVNLGIAEANMMTVAAALASTGKIPFVNTMAGFASARACEQIKIDIAYNNLPVKIVGTHSGFSSGHLGPTHQSLEDLAIMRALPNMTVLVPVDTVETARAVEAAVHIPGPVYIRLGRRPTPLVYQADYDFTVGRAVTLRHGTDVTIVAVGSYPVLAALAACEQLLKMGVSARVLNMHTLKPLDRPALMAAARETHGVVTVEEHNILGGLGGAVAEVVSEQALVPVRRLGVPDTFCDHVGNQQELLEIYGITQDQIVKEVLQLLFGSARKSKS